MTTMAWSVMVSAAVLGASCGAGSTVVRVDRGAPRLVVDGTPVRGRMFWGGPGRAPLPVGPEAREVSFEFVAVEGEAKTATMHVRCGQSAGSIALDDIRVVDVDSGREVIPVCGFERGKEDLDRDWTSWPQDETNTVAAVEVAQGRGRDGSGGLLVTLREPPEGRWPDWHLYHVPNLTLEAGRRYRVSFWARAEPQRDLTVAFYRPGTVFTFLGGPSGPFESQIRLAAAAGVDFVSFPCPLPWPEAGRDPDWPGAEAACRRVLRENPAARLLPRIGMHPPAWWLRAHPEAVMLWEDGPHRNGFTVASPEYRRDAAAALRALVVHLEETFGDRMAGYHPCGQNTGEWFYQDTWGPRLSDYSEAMRDAFRRWLASRYGTDTGLREAWGLADVTLDTAALPSPEARHAAPGGALRSPRQERALVDFAEFQQLAMADCVCALAKAVREGSGGRRLVVFFYGYVFEFGAVGTGPAVSGHYALRRVLECPDIDVLCSPISYWDRGLGGSAPCMTAAESVALAGKLWLREDDTATHRSSGQFPGWRERARTPWETLMQLQRNVAQEALRNQASWWMDLGSSGWFDDPELWAAMRTLEAVDRPMLETPTAFTPDVAAIVDEHSMLYVAQGGQAVTRPCVYEARTALGRMGTPYGQYLLDDVAAGRVSAPLKVFLNAWVLPGPVRRDLGEATRNGVSVWCYAPACFDGNGPTPAAAGELTGFDLVPVSSSSAWAEPTPEGRALGLTAGFGVKAPVQPLFAAALRDGVEVLATYPDGAAAVALRRGPRGASIFVGAPGLTSELLRLAARVAGIHLYAETDCNVYANGPFLALHAAADGEVALHVGAQGAVTDVLTGEAVGNGPRLKLSLRHGETRILRLPAATP
ncbi:MAG: beta-galactosidase [Lentisphaeria bacterium]|nr:beta-galactosidase [Lentisphaeria bacterium]